MNRHTRVGAYAVIEHENRVLLCQLTRSRHWTLPGGGLEFGEDPLLAMHREVLEETGLTVTSSQLLGVNAALGRLDDREIHHIQVIYEASVAAGELRSEMNGTTDLRQWWSWSDLQQLSVTTAVQYVLGRRDCGNTV